MADKGKFLSPKANYFTDKLFVGMCPLTSQGSGATAQLAVPRRAPTALQAVGGGEVSFGLRTFVGQLNIGDSGIAR